MMFHQEKVQEEAEELSPTETSDYCVKVCCLSGDTAGLSVSFRGAGWCILEFF